MGACTFTPRLHHREREDGTRAVYIRLTKDRESAVLAMGFHLPPKHWNPKGTLDKRNWVRTTEPDSEELNQRLEALVRSGRTTTLENPLLGVVALRDLLAAHLAGNAPVKPVKPKKGVAPLTLDAYSTAYVQQRTATATTNTALNYRTMLHRLRDWLGERQLPLAEVSRRDVLDFHAWHLARPGGAPSTARDRVVKLCTILRAAYSEGLPLATPLPFLALALPSAPRARAPRRLTDAQRRAVLDFDLAALTDAHGNERLHASYVVRRDIWHLQYLLRGSRVGDVLQLRERDVLPARILFREDKTGKVKSVQRSPAINELLARYPPTGNPLAYVFPALDHTKPYATPQPTPAESALLGEAIRSRTVWVNYALRRLSCLAGVPTVTSHSARHMFAERAYRRTKDMRLVQKMLNHGSVATTERYLQELGIDTLDEATDHILEGE